ncbi:MAG: hypothetical protein EBR10_06645 [Planctomycetes bacterium]|nr:hypothetical protein [Planctomycetota bacterium]
MLDPLSRADKAAPPQCICQRRWRMPERMSTTAPSRDSTGGAAWPEWVSRWVTAHPWTVVLAATVAAALSVFVSLRNLTLDANTDSLISPDRPFMVRYRAFLDEFGDLEGLTIAVDPRGDDAAAARAIDALVDGLSQLPGIPHAVGRIEANEQWRLAPWSMSQAALRDLLRARAAFPVLLNATHDGEARCVLGKARDLLASAVASGLSASRDEQEARVAGALLLIDAVCPPPGGQSLGAPRAPEYLRADGGSLLFIQIQAQKDFSSLATIEPLLHAIREVIARVRHAEPTVEIGLTGKPVLQADELATSNADTSRGTAVATLIVVGLLIVVFRSVLRPMLAALALGLAFACTYGVATVFIGRLNLLSLIFMLVLVSAGLDYGIYQLALHTDWRRRVRPLLAPRLAMSGGLVPIWVGAATSAVVFFLALVTDFGGLRELGIIAGSGLVICALMMTIVLPALLTIAARAGKDKEVSPEPSTLVEEAHSTVDPWMKGRVTRAVLIASILFSLVSAVLLPRVWFEGNLLELQARGLESIEWEHRILADSSSASWFGAIVCADDAGVDRVRTLAAADPTIARTLSIRDVMAPATPEGAALRGDLATACAVRGEPSEPCEPSQSDEMTALRGEAAAARESLDRLVTLGTLTATSAQLAPLRERSEQLRQLTEALEQPSLARDAALRANDDVQRAAAALRAMAEGAAMTQRESLPKALRNRLVSERGSLLVSVIPKEDIWDPASLAAFTAALSKIDPRATGVPFTVHESLADMRAAFVTMAVWSLVSIGALVWIDVRSIRATLVTLGVLLVGILWTFGCMGAVGASLNLANFFGVPMLLGLGVDGAVHVLHRAREGGDRVTWMWTRRAVVLSAVTTAAGFGTLLFASHRGLQSLGWLMVIGSVCTLLSAGLLLPALLRVAPHLAGRRHLPTAGVGGGDAAAS